MSGVEFRCSQQRDSLSSRGRTLLNILRPTINGSLSPLPPRVATPASNATLFEGDCNNIFRRAKDALL